MSPALQTLPVGSLVFSVLAVDKDTGPAGSVVYSIDEVSVCMSVQECGPHRSSWPPGGSIFHRSCRDLAGWGDDCSCSGPGLLPRPSGIRA